LAGIIAITVPVGERKPQRVKDALAEALQLESLGSILVCDMKASRRSREIAQEAFAEAQEGFAQAGKTLRLLWCREDETVPRWKRAILEALADIRVDWVFLFPCDWDMPHDSTEKMENWRKDWAEMIVKAGGVVVGDYEARPGTSKASFLEVAGMPTIEALFPKEGKAIRELGIRQVRSEWLVVGRELFNRLGQEGVAWTLDAATDLVITCMRNASVQLHVVNLRERFWDEDCERRNPLQPLYQETRFIAGLMVNCVRIERWRRQDPDDAAAAYGELADRLRLGCEVLLGAIERNRPGGRRNEVGR